MIQAAEHGTALPISRDLIGAVEQFYFREARLLDERKYQQWLALVAEDVEYTLPNRHTVFVDPKKRDSEALLNVEQELSHGTDANFRSENYLTLSIRVMRAFKINSWTDNPPARTSRFVSNVEVLPSETLDCLQVYSNILIAYIRHDSDNHMYTARRSDILRRTEEDFLIAKREVLIDWNLVTGPSLGVFF
ncbi:MAG: aromatic-ring-hydroxylating dioxygenase subunit beta [Pseudomonadales bacterium]